MRTRTDQTAQSLRGVAISLPAVRHGTQQPATVIQALIPLLHPGQDGDSADPPAFTLEVGQHPPPIPLLNNLDVEFGQLVPSQSATGQKRQDQVAALPL